MGKFQKGFKPSIQYFEPGRIPPHDLEIEKIVLGSIMMDYHLIGKYPYLKPEVFYSSAHQAIFKAMIELYTEDVHFDLAIIHNRLRLSNSLEEAGGTLYITSLSSLFSMDISNHTKIVMQNYFLRELIRMSHETLQMSYSGTIDFTEIIDKLNQDLINLTDFEVEVQNNLIRTLDATIQDMKAAARGENQTVILTGHKAIDKRFTFRTRYVCIIAGPEGSGKTKFTINLIRGMLDNESELAVQWFSFEDDRSQIIRSFMSMDLRLTTKELQSINYKMTDKDFEKVESVTERYKQYLIEFHDRSTSIENIVSRSKRFGDKFKDKKKIIVIDNLGLVQSDKSGVERDDDIAAKIKSIADNTNSSVILIHHFTKEISRKANIDDGYRPRKEYLKGSTRILDYVQQALFVNLLRKYPDLLAEEKQTSLDFIGTTHLDFTLDNFDKHLWSINSKPCKDSASVSDLRIETFAKIRTLLNQNSKFANGKEITFADIVQKYREYSNYIDGKNKGREEKYTKEKMSIYSFIVRKHFNSSYVPDRNSPRGRYLYGYNENLKYQIDDLFIVESIKNRDDDNLSENAIFRFIVDLGYNLFKEAPDGTIDNS